MATSLDIVSNYFWDLTGRDAQRLSAAFAEKYERICRAPPDDDKFTTSVDEYLTIYHPDQEMSTPEIAGNYAWSLRGGEICPEGTPGRMSFDLIDGYNRLMNELSDEVRFADPAWRDFLSQRRKLVRRVEIALRLKHFADDQLEAMQHILPMLRDSARQTLGYNLLKTIAFEGGEAPQFVPSFNDLAEAAAALQPDWPVKLRQAFEEQANKVDEMEAFDWRHLTETFVQQIWDAGSGVSAFFKSVNVMIENGDIEFARKFLEIMGPGKWEGPPAAIEMLAHAALLGNAGPSRRLLIEKAMVLVERIYEIATDEAHDFTIPGWIAMLLSYPEGDTETEANLAALIQRLLEGQRNGSAFRGLEDNDLVIQFLRSFFSLYDRLKDNERLKQMGLQVEEIDIQNSVPARLLKIAVSEDLSGAFVSLMTQALRFSDIYGSTSSETRRYLDVLTPEFYDLIRSSANEWDFFDKLSRRGSGGGASAPPEGAPPPVSTPPPAAAASSVQDEISGIGEVELYEMELMDQPEADFEFDDPGSQLFIGCEYMSYEPLGMAQ